MFWQTEQLKSNVDLSEKRVKSKTEVPKIVHKSIQFATADEIAEFDEPLLPPSPTKVRFVTPTKGMIKLAYHINVIDVDMNNADLKKLLAHGLLNMTFIDTLFEQNIKVDKAQFHRNLIKV